MSGMFGKHVLAALGFFACSMSAGASDAPGDIHESVYKTCAELHGNLRQQEALLGAFVEAAAEIYKVDLKASGNVQNIAWLIRTGCSVWPDAYASAIVAKAVRVLGEHPKPAPTKLFPHADLTLTDCSLYDGKAPAERKAVTDYVSSLVAAHYQISLPAYWNDEYVRNSINNACQLFPGSYIYEIIGQLLRVTHELPAAGRAGVNPAPGAPARLGQRP